MQTIRDLRFGIRAMARSPLLTIVAVAALGVGIGLNTTIFSLVNAVLFKGLPFEEAHELVHLDTRIIPTGQNAGVSYPELLDWRDQSTTFDGLAGFIPTSTNLSDERRFPENIRGTRVTTDLFSVVRQPTLMGRDFVPEDGEAGAEPVAIIGEGLWRSRYGADPEILGASIRGNGIPFTVVGIMPLGMEFPNNSQIWFALREGEEFEPRENRSLQVIGRLAGGTSIDEAGVEMSGIGARLATAYPETNQDRGVRLRTSSEFYNGGEIRVLFLALMGAVTFVLLIACANVANLLLAQALRRTGETSIRTALGASRWRIIRQLLTESLVLSIVGGGLGIGLAFAGVSLFDRAVASIDGKPYWIDFSIDLTVLGYLAAVAVGTTLLFGLAPALQASRVNINDTLKDGGRSNTGGAGSRRWAGLLIVGELSLTVVLLAW
jgi:predicted permease